MTTLKRIVCMAMSLCLLLSLCLGISAYASGTKPKYYDQASALYELGLFKGTGTNADGTPIYDLLSPANRIQGLVMLIRLLGEEQDALAYTVACPFTDVPAWAQKYAGYAFAKGYTKGTTATTFGADDALLGKAYLTFVLRALGYSDANGDFSYNDANTFAESLGLIEAGQCEGALLRDDCAMVSYNALSANMKNMDTTLLDKLAADGAVTDDAVLASGILTKQVSIPIAVSAGSHTAYNFSFKGADILASFPDAAFLSTAGLGGVTPAAYKEMEFSLLNIWLSTYSVRKYFEGKTSSPMTVGSTMGTGFSGGNNMLTLTILDKNYNMLAYCIIPPGFVCETGSLRFTAIPVFNGMDEYHRLQTVFKKIKKPSASAVYCEQITTVHQDGTETVASYLRVDEAKWPKDLRDFKYYSLYNGGDKAAWLRNYSDARRNSEIDVYGVDTIYGAFIGNDSNDPSYEDTYLYIYDDAKDIIACVRLPEELPVIETRIEE